MKSIEHIHKSWCVKNDGSQLFKDTVIKYLNTKDIDTNYSGNFENRYYGVDKFNHTWSGDRIKDFQKELTLEEFIKLINQEMKYFKLNQTVYHPVHGKGIVITSYLDKYPIQVQFRNNVGNFTQDGRETERGKITLSQTPIPEIVNKSLEDEYIPFTFEDRELLRGKYVRNKEYEEEYLINYIAKNRIGLDTSYYSYEELLEKYEFTDGKPCGKLVN